MISYPWAFVDDLYTGDSSRILASHHLNSPPLVVECSVDPRQTMDPGPLILRLPHPS